MRRILRLAALALAVALAIAAAYYARAVLVARSATPAILQQLSDSGAIELALGDFPEGWLEALLAVEDPGFYQHPGADLWTPGAGITTITQGLVKTLYFERFQPGIAKLEQTLVAVLALDRQVDKETQLRIFVNTAYLGSDRGVPVRGFAQASRAYFGKRFAELSRGEYLQLVAMLIAPEAFHVRARPESNRRRVERIERLLSGSYRPRGLMDLYYGPLTEEEQRAIAPLSYFEAETLVE
jgi:membrane peptidoglycan carboxypeptidase